MLLCGCLYSLCCLGGLHLEPHFAFAAGVCLCLLRCQQQRCIYGQPACSNSVMCHLSLLMPCQRGLMCLKLSAHAPARKVSGSLIEVCPVWGIRAVLVFPGEQQTTGRTATAVRPECDTRVLAACVYPVLLLILCVQFGAPHASAVCNSGGPGRADQVAQ